jgi:hypothetical protein
MVKVARLGALPSTDLKEGLLSLSQCARMLTIPSSLWRNFLALAVASQLLQLEDDVPFYIFDPSVIRGTKISMISRSRILQCFIA